ncbi:AbrB/MazE/SpoVT family DNA-binding domain-containing protein [Agrococcus sp. ARC_14]|uniref:AbrB/MazE/SpoVT family DNA-binding domain-containing protein n=1 Tax=Agrococcus sp. ARC_14 TaxID=2919927 RepID=UPI001F06722E|nr:AbrB/MazE/SpoVT family DNA-binding domain-containing protein [Agrococcus sp. ARC_14]MCH1883368.1 AbrB/MazE/SpoVT family DNA-binding domain-containing protein [Agrococcus sp. ARC_14]
MVPSRMDNREPSEGRWISTVRLGPKSQIVIPKEVREIFGLKPGDSLLLLADREKGIALVDPVAYGDVVDKVIGATGAPIPRGEP